MLNMLMGSIPCLTWSEQDPVVVCKHISVIFTTVLDSVNTETLHHLMAHNAEIMMSRLNWRNP
jgi:hypothetical protein